MDPNATAVSWCGATFPPNLGRLSCIGHLKHTLTNDSCKSLTYRSLVVNMASAGEVTCSDVLFVTAPRINEPEWTKQLSTFTPETEKQVI